MMPARIPPLRRFFQLQIPQMFRPTVSSFLARTVGYLDLEAPAAGLTAVAYWARFSRWCSTHPVSVSSVSKEDLYKSVITEQNLDSTPITYLEFGVYRGASIKWWVENIANPSSTFCGFDTFTGLPERWRPTEPEGHFDAQGKVPDIPDTRCHFEVGLFQDTLPSFIKRTNLTNRLVINLDADLFTSTMFVLSSLAGHLKPGDIIFFDEFSCPLDEFRAFEEFVRCFRVKFKLVCAQYGYTRVCIAIA